MLKQINPTTLIINPYTPNLDELRILSTDSQTFILMLVLRI